MIPVFDDGVLPDGIHACTLDEVAERFGQFDRSDRRCLLTAALKRYLAEVTRLGIATAVLIDGSYVTIKAEPNDIDLILIMREAPRFEGEILPSRYNALSSRIVRKQFGLDIQVVSAESAQYFKLVNFFSRVRPADPIFGTRRLTKGLLRIDL